MVKQNYKWVGIFLKETQNAWADLLYYTINVIPSMSRFSLDNSNQEEKDCWDNFQRLSNSEKDYIRKNHRFSFKVLKKIIVKNNKRIPSNELTKVLNFFIERGLLKKDRGYYIPLDIAEHLYQYQLSQEINLNNSFPYSFNNFEIKGVPFKGLYYPDLNKDLVKISLELDKTLKKITPIQKKEFNQFMKTFYKKPNSKEYRIKNEFRVILNNLKKDIFKALTHPVASLKAGNPKEEFTSFLSIIFYGSSKRNRDLINNLDDKSREILFRYLLEIWNTCSISYPVIIWKKYSLSNGRKFASDYNEFAKSFVEDLSKLFDPII